MASSDIYRFWLLPRPDRFPRRRSDWLRPALVVAVVVAAGLATWQGPWVLERLGCRDGFPAEGVWSQDGECVGVSPGPYAFERPEFAEVMATVDRQNRESREHGCPAGTTPVTVGVVVTMGSPHSGARSVHELEGFAAAQARANGAGCIHPVLLKVGNMGAAQQAAEPVARLLKEDPDVVAVVGMGLSDQRSADAADVLGSGEDPVPMVASLITAEGFDADGSAEDRPDFGACDPAATYPDGVGDGYFFRVAFRNGSQIPRLLAHLRGAPDFVIVPRDKQDPYTCTALPLVRDRVPGEVPNVDFDPKDPATVAQVAQRVCRADRPVTAFYIARSRDLARFLHAIDREYSGGRCTATSVTIASTSDAVRLRAPEPDKDLEEIRSAALGSQSFRNGTLRLLYTPLADADSLRAAPTGEFTELERRFRDNGFDLSHLDNGWAVNAYDALLAVANALSGLNATQPVSRGVVTSAIAAFSPDNPYEGAGGPIAFDNSHNRRGSPTLVQLCPGGGRPTSVKVPDGADPTTTLCPTS